MTDRNWTRGVGWSLSGNGIVEETCSKIRDLIHVINFNLPLKMVGWRAGNKALTPSTPLFFVMGAHSTKT